MSGIHTQFPASISLLNLSGKNGFAIKGGTAGDNTGYSVSSAGDVNADGVTDIIVGTPGSNTIYIVFGNAGLGSSGNINLLSLNGINGFSITGDSVTSLGQGDINADGISDLIIGCYASSPGGKTFAGRTYIVFGKSGLGSLGSLNLASLNGTNGFSLTGVSAYDRSAYSVSAIGDINVDGIGDFIIGAESVTVSGMAGAGTSYIFFGSAGGRSFSTLSLSGINGSNGFIIQGLYVNHECGLSVSSAGDVNADGIADMIIGAPGASSSPGTCYVVFGKAGIGSSGTLSLSSLNGSNGFSIQGISGDKTGASVSGGGDVNGDGIADLLIGASASSKVYVVFGQIGIGSSGSLSLSRNLERKTQLQMSQVFKQQILLYQSYCS